MKRILCLLLALCLMLPVMAMADDAVTIGHIQYAAHGTRGFAEMTVVLQGDVIIAAYIDEYQFMSVEDTTPVPNGDNAEGLGANFPEGQALASKRVNNEYYSANMAKAGATQELATSYDAIQAFVVGKTVAELEAIVADQDDAAKFLEADVVSGSTLADTLNYVKGLLEAAKVAK